MTGLRWTDHPRPTLEYPRCISRLQKAMLCYPGWLRVRKNSTVVYNLLGAIQLFFSCSNGVIPHTFDDGSRLGHVTSLVELKNSEGPRGGEGRGAALEQSLQRRRRQSHMFHGVPHTSHLVPLDLALIAMSQGALAFPSQPTTPPLSVECSACETRCVRPFPLPTLVRVPQSKDRRFLWVNPDPCPRSRSCSDLACTLPLNG